LSENNTTEAVIQNSGQDKSGNKALTTALENRPRDSKTVEHTIK